ncbi:RNA polymerase sigma factor SigZ [Anaerocolumna sedimenticola]|uniref:RNA polymerase sigma factor SigZ n=1 Tax=Anaerocolumna sedimenticola TaxID=2696063 RepID=A0A6P1TSL9_9FIRM|nr:RNA polymerase sigma factor SigZ [Anaerocolumna sedimenticola]QHQ63347.1 RNA polymerase sigma factor SigZ [Anaerocolumna sedimenticola]
MEYSTEKIWEEFSLALRSFISHRISNSSQVEDILQDVFVKIHSNIDSLKESTKIRSWVYQITRNTIIDYYRKQKIKFEDIDEIPLEEEEAINKINEMVELEPVQKVTAGLRGMIDDLPEKYSQALYLVEFEGLTQVELANKLGISVSGAKSRVQRGRRLLKDSLMKCCHFEFDRYGTIINVRPVCCSCCYQKK